jgi:hypothetical protein
MKKSISIKFNNVEFYLEESNNINKENIEYLLKDLNNECNIITSAGLNPDTFIIKLNNYTLNKFKIRELENKNFCAIIYDDNDFSTFYYNSIFGSSSARIISKFKYFIDNENLLKESLLLYAEPFKYMEYLISNKIEEAIDEIKKSKGNETTFSSCALNYALKNYSLNDIEFFLNSSDIIRYLNNSKNKDYFIQFIFDKYPYLFNNISEKLLLSKNDFLKLFKNIAQHDYYFDFRNISNFIETSLFKKYSKKIKYNDIIEIIDIINKRAINKTKSGLIIQSKIKSIINLNNF